MKRLFLLAFATAPLLGGCTVNAIDDAAHQSVVNTVRFRQIVCIDGVEYIGLPMKDGATLAPHYKPDGSLYACRDSVPTLR